MSRKLNIGIGAATAAIAATMAIGVASAAAGGQPAAGSAAAVSSVTRHITKAEARRIALATVPHSRLIEVESDDLHDRAVWKVKLATPHGRVVIDVDKRTGKATIAARGGGGGHDEAAAVSRIASAGQAAEAGDDRGADLVADDCGQDVRDNDGVREDREHHDRGDDGIGR